jgi:hypothetical protein
MVENVKLTRNNKEQTILIFFFIEKFTGMMRESCYLLLNDGKTSYRFV